MKLIVNADDFGHSKGVNLGIAEAFNNGVVRSTTIMAGMPGFDHAVALAKENPGLHIGAHLTLTAGRSVGGVYKTITDEQGNFLHLTELTKRAEHNEIDLHEVELEYEAQIQKILAAGIKITHFDSHHHTHNLQGIITVFLKMAKKYGVNVRIQNKELLQGDYSGIKTTDYFVHTFYAENTTIPYIKELLQTYTEGSLEVMCHPAYLDYTLKNTSSYNENRTVELHVLTSDELKEYIAEKGISLSSFADL